MVPLMSPRLFFSIMLCGKYFNHKKKRQERTTKGKEEFLDFNNLTMNRWQLRLLRKQILSYLGLNTSII